MAQADLAGRGMVPIDARDGQFPRYRHLRSGLTFVMIEPGAFMMGSDAPESHADEQPVRLISISRPFLIAVTPCSQDAWRRGAEDFRLQTDVHDLASAAQFPVFGDRAQMPIYHVSWNACAEWCLSNGLELPTEAQWEYATRAGTATRFWFGDVGLRQWEELAEHVWYAEHNDREAPVLGALTPNPWGLHDVHGTIWEWCRDTYEVDYYRRAPAADPCNLSAGHKRVRRGGSWDVPAICCRSSARHCDAADYKHGTIGFRPSLTL